MDDFSVLMEYERRKLREERLVVISGDIDQPRAHEFIEDTQLLVMEDEKLPITIIISSQGGNVFSGLAIIRAIRMAQQQGIKVIGEVYGHACSMAFFILECCDERVMGKLDIVMAHGVTTGFSGDIKNLEAETKLLTYWHGEFAELLANRCTGDSHTEPGAWFEVLRDNTPQWYTAEECLQMGLIDRVCDDSKNQEDSS